ncbi:MAG: DUF3105 domain-containing protein [Chloroflexi bacterium]|nr:DUF3105 domain-containing protein [Chloroflexota bacterium]
MTEKLSKREQRRAHQRRQKIRGNLIWGGLGLGVLAIIGFFVWQGARPQAGETMPVMQSTHITTDSDPGQYNSDPPTSGPHYPEEAGAGFYDTNNYEYPAGYLVHNLEHGYVIFWYNCDKLSDSACNDLKAQIKTVMDDLGGTKLIAYPWPSLDVPFAMTSWGQLEKFGTFDAEKAKAFVRANLNHAPEPGAP